MYLVKKTFEYIGLLVLVVFSFYYTDKVVKMVNKNDPLMEQMEQIVKYASVNNSSCIEGYVTDEGVVLGVSGLVVDENTSYSNMKGFGYNEELFVFEKDTCSINKREYVDKYIIKGNESKNAVSLLVLVDDISLISSVNDIASNKGINLNLIPSFFAKIHTINLFVFIFGETACLNCNRKVLNLPRKFSMTSVK